MSNEIGFDEDVSIERRCFHSNIVHVFVNVHTCGADRLGILVSQSISRVYQWFELVEGGTCNFFQ